jgi:hypothetical protein
VGQIVRQYDVVGTMNMSSLPECAPTPKTMNALPMNIGDLDIVILSRGVTPLLAKSIPYAGC